MAESRRLAAIMFADMAGYTAATHSDEVGTLNLVQEQEELVRPLLAIHKGRMVKSTGDGFLAEFDSALHAIQCAIDIQQHLHERNARPGIRPIPLRIGVHLGDVEQRGTDIFGDAVNIASRVEPLADPGGVCLSEPIFVQVRNRVPYQMEKLGPKSLKGIREPMEVYRMVLPWESEEASDKRSALPRLAVLPLANISPDPKDEYFADGLTEELITILSQIRDLQVIARTSVLPYKSNPKPIAQIGAELGVSSVLEGSVRMAGNRIRVTVQMIDVGSQAHAWAETYDRNLVDIFAVQTEVAKLVAGALRIRLGTAERRRLESRPKVHPESYLAYLRGRSLLFQRSSDQRSRNAKSEFERAISIDPANAGAYSGLSDAIREVHWDGLGLGSREEWLSIRRAHTGRAIELGPDLAEGHCSMALIHQDDWKFEEAEKEFQMALSLNPSYAYAHYCYGDLLAELARPEEALREVTRAEELDPNSSVNISFKAAVLVWLRRLDAAEAELERMRKLREYEPMSEFRYHAWLAWIYNAKPDIPRVLQELDRIEELGEFEDAPGVRWMEVAAHSAFAGEKDRARRNLAKLEAMRPAEQTETQWWGPWRAMAYSLIGDLDRSAQLLKEAFEAHGLYGFTIAMLRCEPRLAPLRQDPRVAEILKRMTLA